MTAHKHITMMDQQLMKSSSSSSSSGSSSGCMSFLQSFLGRAPAVVPAVVPTVLCYEEPASPMPLEIEAAANTAAPPLDLQCPASSPSELLSLEEQPTLAELQHMINSNLMFD